MKRFENAFKKLTPNASLSEVEKNAMRQHLVAYQKAHPVTEATKSHLYSQATVSPLSFLTLNKYRMPILAGLAAIIFTGGAGVSLAAEGTAPGDLLYPIKVSINEEARAALALSSEAKIEWDTRRAGRRLEEAEKLAVEGRLTEEDEKDLEARFALHAESASNRIEEIQEDKPENAVVAATTLSAVLRAHGELLDSSREEGSNRSTLRASVKAREAVASAQSARFNGASAPTGVSLAATMEVQAKVAPQTAIETTVVLRMKQAAEASYRDAERLFKRSERILSAEAKAHAELSLETSKHLLEEGRVALEAENNSAALQAFSQSLSTSEELKVFLKSSVSRPVRNVVPKVIDRTDTSAEIQIGGDDSNDSSSNDDSGKVEDSDDDNKSDETSTPSSGGGTSGSASGSGSVQVGGGGVQVAGSGGVNISF